MGGKRTDLISERDVEVLGFIARFGVVPRSAVARWAATARSTTYARERRLHKDGLITVQQFFVRGEPLLIATKSGLHASRHGQLRPARISLASIHPESTVGHRVLSKRQILARERAEGKGMLSASLSSGRFHRADLLRVDRDEELGKAIEVVLTAKGAARLDELLDAWCRAVAEQRIIRVTYRCTPRSRCYVEKAIERTGTGEMVWVQEL